MVSDKIPDTIDNNDVFLVVGSAQALGCEMYKPCVKSQSYKVYSDDRVQGQSQTEPNRSFFLLKCHCQNSLCVFYDHPSLLALFRDNPESCGDET